MSLALLLATTSSLRFDTFSFVNEFTIKANILHVQAIENTMGERLRTAGIGTQAFAFLIIEVSAWHITHVRDKDVTADRGRVRDKQRKC